MCEQTLTCYTAEELEQWLIPADTFSPFPKIDDRPAWEKFSDDLRGQLVQDAQKACEQPWPQLPATLVLDYTRTGNQARHLARLRGRRNLLRAMVLGECVENKGRFVDPILDAIWSICEETSWIIPMHQWMQLSGTGLPDVREPFVDLCVARTGADLAWVGYLLGTRLDAITPVIRQRIHYEVDRRVLQSTFERDDMFWMGLVPNPDHLINNWTTCCCFRWLTCVLLVERDPVRRGRSVHKILRCLDVFYNTYSQVGGCDEGPGYWHSAGGSLFCSLELLAMATGGRIHYGHLEKLRNIGRYICKVHIAGDYMVNFADARGRLDVHGSLIRRFGHYVQDPDMIALGQWVLQESKEHERNTAEVLVHSFCEVLPALFDSSDAPAPEAHPPLLGDAWLEDIQVMIARDHGGTSRGLFLAAKGGHNNESHNHNDLGNFMVYVDGRPVLIDAGPETYRRETFGPDRYTIWAMQSQWHNVPHVNGQSQSPGSQYHARDVRYHADGESAQLSMDLARAYPAEADLDYWRRAITLVRNKAVTVTDEFAFKGAPATAAVHLLTCCEPTIVRPGAIQLNRRTLLEDIESGQALLTFDGDLLGIEIEARPIDDETMRSVWGDQLWRIKLSLTSPAQAQRVEITLTHNEEA